MAPHLLTSPSNYRGGYAGEGAAHSQNSSEVKLKISSKIFARPNFPSVSINPTTLPFVCQRFAIRVAATRQVPRIPAILRRLMGLDNSMAGREVAMGRGAQKPPEGAPRRRRFRPEGQALPGGRRTPKEPINARADGIGVAEP